MEKNSILSKKDLLILKELILDGRKSSSSISKEIDLGKEIVNYRIKRLIKENLILKFIPKINEKKAGYTEYVILLKLNLDDEISREKFIKENIGSKYLIWIVKSSKGWDVVIKIYCDSVENFKEKLQEILSNLKEKIARYYTIFSSEEIIENEKKILLKNLFNENLQIENDFNILKNKQNLIEIDEKDKSILNLLENDGRIQYSKISNILNISPDTVKYRIDKLKENGVIENFEPIVNFSKIGFLQYASIIKFSYLNNKNENLFLDLIKKTEIIIKAIKNLSNYEYFLVFVCEKKDEILKFKDSLEKNLKNDLIEFEYFLIN